MIKAICFDLDGVYFTPDSFQRFKRNLPKSVADEGIVNTVLYKSDEMNKFKRGEIAENAYWEFVKKELGVTVSTEEIFKCLQDSYEVNQDVVSFVKVIRQKGYKSCACSNNFVTRIRELNKKFNFLEDFDFTVFSYEIGVTKPDKKIFETLVNKSGLEASEIAYSDDEPSRLTGALELGIQAFVYENFDQFKSKLDELGVKTHE